MSTLTSDQETELFARWRKNGDRRALEPLLESVRGYALFLARRLRANRAAWEDAVAEAMKGAVEAAVRFDPTRGVRFVTYAGHWMRAAVLGVVRDTTEQSAEDLTEREESLASPGNGADEQVNATQVATLVRRITSTLEPRLRSIVESRFLTEEQPTLADVARDLGLSRERARQLELEALEKLRRHARGHRLSGSDLLAA
jgi:RNA polymerase sigma-32 factor